MENGFKIMGQNLSPERKEKFAQKHKEIKKEAMTPYTNELEKSEKAKEIISFVNVCLKKEFDKMGLVHEDIPFEKIHILNEGEFKENFPEEKESIGGFSSAYYKDANIKAPEGEVAQVFKTIIHEMVHLASHNVYFLEDDEDTKKTYRTGYLNNQYLKQNFHQHFHGFNEGIIDLVVSEMVQENLDAILKMLDLKKEDWKEVKWYYDESRLVNIIAEKIAKQKNESFNDVYQRFKQGLFSGEMMHLRDIEKAFGNDALRIFSYLNSGVDEDGREELNKNIYEFFKTEDVSRRNELHDEIMKNRQF